MIETILGLIALAIVAVGLCYFLLAMGAGVMELRTHERRGRLVKQTYSEESEDSDGPLAVESPAPTVYSVFYLIPCLNEEAVIEQTVGRLLRDPNATVIVIDDASDDRTAKLAAAAGPRAMVLRRQLPNARLGKGPALNAGFQILLGHVRAAGLDPSTVIVCVMDADGRLSAGALGYVLPLFDDPQVGGAQLAVRIRNRATNLLTRVQDFEFWGLSAVSQFGRVRFGTVSLGGNGQFTRLSALLELDGDPWTTSLTEDLDLAVTLLVAGWRLTSTVHASVDQQALTELRPLIRQRMRWFQGHMTCGKRLPEIWRSRRLSNAGVLELTLYLLVPWIMVLPWSIIFHIGAYYTLTHLSGPAGQSLFKNTILTRVAIIGAWYLLSFFPSIVSGYLYYRQDHSLGRWRTLLLGHMLVATNYLAYVACWRAFIRMHRGETGWVKTVRLTEGGPSTPTPRSLPGAPPPSPAFSSLSGGLVGLLTMPPPPAHKTTAPTAAPPEGTTRG